MSFVGGLTVDLHTKRCRSQSAKTSSTAQYILLMSAVKAMECNRECKRTSINEGWTVRSNKECIIKKSVSWSIKNNSDLGSVAWSLHAWKKTLRWLFKVCNQNNLRDPSFLAWPHWILRINLLWSGGILERRISVQLVLCTRRFILHSVCSVMGLAFLCMRMIRFKMTDRCMFLHRERWSVWIFYSQNLRRDRGVKGSDVKVGLNWGGGRYHNAPIQIPFQRQWEIRGDLSAGHGKQVCQLQAVWVCDQAVQNQDQPKVGLRWASNARDQIKW